MQCVHANGKILLCEDEAVREIATLYFSTYSSLEVLQSIFEFQYRTELTESTAEIWDR